MPRCPVRAPVPASIPAEPPAIASVSGPYPWSHPETQTLWLPGARPIRVPADPGPAHPPARRAYFAGLAGLAGLGLAHPSGPVALGPAALAGPGLAVPDPAGLGPAGLAGPGLAVL